MLLHKLLDTIKDATDAISGVISCECFDVTVRHHIDVKLRTDALERRSEQQCEVLGIFGHAERFENTAQCRCVVPGLIGKALNKHSRIERWIDHRSAEGVLQ